MYKYVVCLLVVMGSAVANAGDQYGKIIQMVARSDGLHFVFLEGAHNAKPGCAANYEYWMIKNENSQAGKTQISMLLAAYAAGKPVSIWGTNTCTRWGDGEDIDGVSVAP